jgi:hypothetical protein
LSNPQDLVLFYALYFLPYFVSPTLHENDSASTIYQPPFSIDEAIIPEINLYKRASCRYASILSNIIRVKLDERKIIQKLARQL